MAKKSTRFFLNKKVRVNILIVLFFVSIISGAIGFEMEQSKKAMNATKNEYQQEINDIVSTDFILVSSSLVQGIDVGTTLTDEYTTHLTYHQAIRVIEDHANKKGYATPVNAGCLGGIDFDRNGGSLEICETKTRDSNGVSTFQVSLNQ